MKKKFIIIFIIIFIILGILLFPKLTIYKDGGTKVYSAILYKYIEWNKMINIDMKYNKKQLIIFPNNFKKLDTYIEKNNTISTEIEDIKKLPEKEEIKKNELSTHFDYPIFENSEIDKIIKFWGESLITKSKQEIKQNKNISTHPELNFDFEIYENKYVKSIVYIIKNSIYKTNPTENTKIFYIGNDGKILEKDDILNIKNKEEFKIFLAKNLKKEKLDIKDLNFYFDKENIYFILGKNEYINIKINDFQKYLNPEIFINLIEKQDKKIIGEKDLLEKKDIVNSIITEEKETLEKDFIKTNKKYISLTFDDGPSKKLTPKLLDILKKYDIKATFCVLGKNTSFFPEIVKREFEEGHNICNHSWNHPNLTKLKEKDLKEEIEKTDDEIIKAIGEKPKFFRPPYGAFNKDIQKVIGRTILMWNVDSVDWKNRNIEKNIKSVEKDIKNGSIILFHDIHKESIDTIEPLIIKLKNQNYEFLTVEKLLQKGQKLDFSQKVCYGEFNCN